MLVSCLIFVIGLTLGVAVSPPVNLMAEVKGPSEKCKKCEDEQRSCLETCVSEGYSRSMDISQNMQMALNYRPYGSPGTWSLSQGHPPGTAVENKRQKPRKTRSVDSGRSRTFVKDLQMNKFRVPSPRSNGDIPSNSYRPSPPAGQPAGPPGSNGAFLRQPWRSDCVRLCLNKAYFCNLRCLEN